MDYEKGLNYLKQYARDKSWLYELDIYDFRLHENLQSERLYGTSEQVRSDRARIVAELNRLTQEQLGVRFHDLCQTVPSPIQMNSSIADQVQETYVLRRQQDVAVCYSHHDERYARELRTHLAHYIHTRVINYWDDTKILPGAKWREEIHNALRKAQVAILLLSADFFASDFIIQNELPLLLDTAAHQKITIFCVIVRPCLFNDTELTQFQAINDPSTPLSTMSYGAREKVWVKVAEHVRDRLLKSD